MILVTVGTHRQPFDRLVRAADELATHIAEPTVIQFGQANYHPKNGRAFAFTDSIEMAALTASARIVITHAAAGAILLGIQQRKPLIVVPRLARWDEHLDDHQLELARALAAAERVVHVTHPTAQTLFQAMQTVDLFPPVPIGSKQLSNAISQQLDVWDQPTTASGWQVGRR